MACIGASRCLFVYFNSFHFRSCCKQTRGLQDVYRHFGAFFLFMAIANYKMNFYEANRMLPVSLVLITSTCFMMALYFTNHQRTAEDRWFHVFHRRSPVRVWELAAAGRRWIPARRREIRFQHLCRPNSLPTKVRKSFSVELDKNKVQGAIGKGQCPLCHAFHEGMLGERAPNLDRSSGASKQKRLEDPKYHQGKSGCSRLRPKRSLSWFRHR